MAATDPTPRSGAKPPPSPTSSSPTGSRAGPSTPPVPARAPGKLERHLGSLRGTRIALLGLAFKADTDDMREASSLVLAARLRAEGATVVGYDPVAMKNAAELLGDEVELAASMLEAVTGADAAVIVTEWGEFRQVCTRAVRDAMRRPLVVDGRNLLDPAAARAAGFAYESVGRPSAPADDPLGTTADADIAAR